MNRRALTQFLIWAGMVWLARTGHAGDWPQWRGPNRDGVWSETGLAETFPPEGLKVRWRVPVGRGWSSPVVSGGRVYVTDVQLKKPSAKERLVCLDERTGKLRWAHTHAAKYPEWAFQPDGGGPRATPIVQDGRVYTLGAMAQLCCLDAVTGRVIWEKALAPEYQLEAFSGITASPLIEGDLLILFVCGKPAACVVALNKKTGREVWRALDDGFTYSSLIAFTAGGRRQLIVWTQQAVTSLDPATGRTWWRELLATPGDVAVATPVQSGTQLLMGGLMMKLGTNPPLATIVWPESRAAMKRVFSNTSSPLLLGDHVYYGKITGELVCVEAATGRLVWQTNSVTSLKNGASMHLTPNGNSVLLYTDQGNLIRARLSAQGYQELSRARLMEPTYPFGGRDVAWAPPAYANGHVFARNDKELACASLEP